METFHNVTEARLFYGKCHIDTIPLRDGEKAPYLQNWQDRNPNDMWRGAPPNANIGIRCGGVNGVAVLDCDEKTIPGTFENAQHFFAGLGYGNGSYPVVSTASGIGRHIYFRTDKPLDGHMRLLAEDFGAGEFRYGPGSMVVAPPSEVSNMPYQLLRGDFRNLPRIEVAEISQITRPSSSASELVRAQHNVSRYAWGLLKGKGGERYQSRSEAEYAILVSLVNTGHEFESALSLFQKYPCAGKFHELYNVDPTHGISWLYRSYESARIWAENHESPERQKILQIMRWAESIPWPGRTGSTDRATFLAHLAIAYRAATSVYAASCRSLAETAAISLRTASKATKRIIKQELITLEKVGSFDRAAIYCLNKSAHMYTLPHPPSPVGKCIHMRAHDAFRRKGLGKSALEVCEVLIREGPLQPKQIAEYTGRHIGTIRRVLKRCSSLVDKRTGEYVPVVEKVDKRRWRILDADLDADLDKVANLLGTDGMGQRQKLEHARQRRIRQRSLRARYRK